jgi:hypothetical protein
LLGDSDELLGQVLVTVSDSAGVHVPGNVEAWSGGAVAVTWHPARPLPPNTSFTLTAVIIGPGVAPPAASRGTNLTAVFHSGPSAASPLRLAGDLRATLETYDAPRWGSCTDCGTGCVSSGSVRSLRARVSIPAAEGGFTLDTYAAELQLFRNSPGDRSSAIPGLTAERLTAGQPLELLRPLWPESAPFAPCFTLRVTDPAGHHVDAPPLCLPALDVNETIERLDGKPPSVTIPPPPVRPEPVEGCGFASGGAKSAGWASWVVVGLLMVLGRRAWRAKRSWRRRCAGIEREESRSPTEGIVAECSGASRLPSLRSAAAPALTPPARSTECL